MSTPHLRILVYPHAMDLGGSQLNAIELAGAVRDLGHEVVVVGEDGELVDVVEQLGLERVRLATDRRRPSLHTIRSLRRLVSEQGFDIVHGYEWPPGLEAAAAAFPTRRVGAVCTIMSMAVAPFLPKYLPLVVGTRALQSLTAASRPGPVHLIEPPVDVAQNAPGFATDEFRARYGLLEEDPASPPGRVVDIAVIGRLVPELKLEGILTAIDVVADLARKRAVRLIIVGDGVARSAVEERAASANRRAGWRAVVLTGQLLEPRPAYAAADVMLGMGGSALRALAFAKPLVVQGERGFWELLTPESSRLFLEQGWYGVGSGRDGEQRLFDVLQRLLDDPALRADLGVYGRDLVVERFSLQHAARTQEEIYRQALGGRGSPGAIVQSAAGLRSAAGVFVHKVRRRQQRRRGAAVRDDFNAVALAGKALDGEAEADERDGRDE